MHVANSNTGLEQQNGEDESNPSTWRQFPGQENLYRCDHSSWICIDGTCGIKNHNRCRQGLDFRSKKTALQRAGSRKTKEAAEKTQPSAREARRESSKAAFKADRKEAIKDMVLGGHEGGKVTLGVLPTV
jgi:hypothetical protein